MSIQDVRKNDFEAIKNSLKKYLDKKMTLMELINNIEVLSDATFNTSETEDLYLFLLDGVGDLESEYFMKVDEVTNDDYFNYRKELIHIAKKFLKELESEWKY